MPFFTDDDEEKLELIKENSNLTDMLFSLFLSNYKLQLLTLAFKISDERDTVSLSKAVRKILNLIEDDMWKELLGK